MTPPPRLALLSLLLLRAGAQPDGAAPALWQGGAALEVAPGREGQGSVEGQAASRRLLTGACGGFGCQQTCANFDNPICPLVYPNLTTSYEASTPVYLDITFGQVNNVVGSYPTMLAVAYSAYMAIKTQFPSAWPNNRWIPSLYVGCNQLVTEGAYMLTFYDVAFDTRAQLFADQFQIILDTNATVFLNNFLKNANIGQMSTATGVTPGIGTIVLKSPPPPSQSPPMTQSPSPPLPPKSLLSPSPPPPEPPSPSPPEVLSPPPMKPGTVSSPPPPQVGAPPPAPPPAMSARPPPPPPSPILAASPPSPTRPSPSPPPPPAMSNVYATATLGNITVAQLTAPALQAFCAAMASTLNVSAGSVTITPATRRRLAAANATVAYQVQTTSPGAITAAITAASPALLTALNSRFAGLSPPLVLSSIALAIARPPPAPLPPPLPAPPLPPPLPPAPPPPPQPLPARQSKAPVMGLTTVIAIAAAGGGGIVLGLCALFYKLHRKRTEREMLEFGLQMKSRHLPPPPPPPLVHRLMPGDRVLVCVGAHQGQVCVIERVHEQAALLVNGASERFMEDVSLLQLAPNMPFSTTPTPGYTPLALAPIRTHISADGITSVSAPPPSGSETPEARAAALLAAAMSAV